MPIYEYLCDCGVTQVAFFKIKDKPDTIPCACGKEAGKILSPGLVLGDDMPAWMRHPQALGCLQSKAERPIQTRSEYNAYLKQNNIAEESTGR